VIERVTELESAGELEVGDAVAEEGKTSRPWERTSRRASHLYDAGHRLRPSDLGLLRDRRATAASSRWPSSPGWASCRRAELVAGDPDPGEVVETNGLTVSRLAQRWGARATDRDVVTDDPESLRVAIQRDLTKDVIVTTGGSSVGERDLLPEVIDGLGEVLVHGVGLKPGHPVCLGIVEDTPVLALPGYPVACIVNAVQFPDRPCAGSRGRRPIPIQRHGRPSSARSRANPGAGRSRGFGSRRDEDESDRERDEPEYAAIPTRASGSGVLSSVALADGWVVVDDDREGGFRPARRSRLRTGNRTCDPRRRRGARSHR